MKTLNSNKVSEIFKNYIDGYKNNLRDYTYQYNHISTEDAIHLAQTIKTLEVVAEDIEALDMSVADCQPVYDALKDLAGHKVLKGTKKYDAALKIIADFLEINLDDFKEDNEEDEDEQ